MVSKKAVLLLGHQKFRVTLKDTRPTKTSFEKRFCNSTGAALLNSDEY